METTEVKYDVPVFAPCTEAELEAFFKAFDVSLEAMIEKLLAINNADALHVLVERSKVGRG